MAETQLFACMVQSQILNCIVGHQLLDTIVGPQLLNMEIVKSFAHERKQHQLTTHLNS